jgi:hypothetical protein
MNAAGIFSTTPKGQSGPMSPRNGTTSPWRRIAWWLGIACLAVGPLISVIALWGAPTTANPEVPGSVATYHAHQVAAGLGLAAMLAGAALLFFLHLWPKSAEGPPVQ